MLQLFALFVIVLPTVIAEEDAASSPQGCNVNNYNNNYYAGPQKDVQNLLVGIKKQLDELKMQVTLLTKCKGRTPKKINSIPRCNIF